MSAVNRAEKVTGVVSAARMRDRLAGDLHPDEPPATQREADDAIDLLERRFPELRGVDLGSADDFAASKNPPRGRAMKVEKPKAGRGKTLGERNNAALDAERKKREKLERAQAKQRSPKRSARGRSRRRGSSSRRRRAGGRLPRGVRRAVTQTGLPGAGRSVSEMAMRMAGATIGLALVYLLLSNASQARRGRSAVEQIGALGSRSITRLIRPVDPLAPRGAAKKDAGAGAAVGGSLGLSLGEGVGESAGSLEPLSGGARPEIKESVDRIRRATNRARRQIAGAK